MPHSIEKPATEKPVPEKPGPGKPGLAARAGLLAIAAYQLVLSPVLYAFGIRCRHEPSCSHYTADALRLHGLWRGGWMGLGRFLRCRPGGTHGYDPVPEGAGPVAWWKIWAFRERPVKVNQSGCGTRHDGG
ncbi:MULTISPECIES: membrane protein insertion efficiency factor YidD [Marinicauda]|jgi:uncharacterized protein|uniref:membrane protein insertion efficiency factor YidD n=1 Tax=Marinicauda TaxID=1649466 RepID=UPI0022DF9AC0|nr:membrane protein insertion efficiency factor YidD [Marinicauda sp. Alg238-R41]